MHVLPSDTAALRAAISQPARRKPSYLVPSRLIRWWVRHRLNRGEAYLFYLLRQVSSRSLIGDVIAGATYRPTVDGFRRVTAHLASQCNDSPRVMAEIVGEELVLLLKAQGAVYRIDQTCDGVAVVDLRHVKGGARFRVNLNESHVYRVVESSPTMVLYIRDGLTDAVVRAYPKEEGPVNVYLQPTDQ